ncbi:hypothetical protein DFQ30_004356, partial [Apophysomyces sp. BC1015]
MPGYDVPRNSVGANAPYTPPTGALAAILRRPRLTHELTLIVIVKIAVLLVFKYTLFSHPQAPHMELPPAQVAQALL